MALEESQNLKTFIIPLRLFKRKTFHGTHVSARSFSKPNQYDFCCPFPIYLDNVIVFTKPNFVFTEPNFHKTEGSVSENLLLEIWRTLANLK